MFSQTAHLSTKVSLFSSTGSHPLQLFSSHSDADLPSDSFVHLLIDHISQPVPREPAVLLAASPDDDGHTLNQTVLHIQSPTISTTFIRSPPSSKSPPLALKLPWCHLQVRNLHKEWSFEVGLADSSGREGIIRCSTFQKRPRLIANISPPLLHLPLAFPTASSHPLTAWSTIALHLPTLISKFSLRLVEAEAEDRSPESPASVVHLPGGSYSHVTYVKVYATCRLRRIWFSDSGTNQNQPWEFALYGTVD